MWTLISPTSDGTRWKCRCDCGTVKDVLEYNLKEAKTKSCGCVRVQKHRAQMAASFPEVPNGVR
jgi:hypothetical protein